MTNSKSLRPSFSFEFRERYDEYDDSLTSLGTAGSSTAVQNTSPTPAKTTYSVVSGDTLWGISNRYNVKLEDLLKVNPGIKNPNLIHVGEEVVIP